MREPLLSVVLPNYNHAQYLAYAIDAILGQSSPPDEIIVIDDASTDDSRQILAEYQSRHPNLIVLLNEQNFGTLSALQRGLSVARGRYIYFAAADDQILPGFFSMAISRLEAAPSVGLFCAETILVDGVTGLRSGTRPIVRPLRKGGLLSAKGVEGLLKRADNFIHTGSAIFRRQAALDKSGFNTKAGSFSDGLLARKIALTEGLWFEPVLVSNWFIHSAGLSRATALDRQKAVDALIQIPKLIETDRDFPVWYANLFRRRWRFGSARVALDVAPLDNDLLAAMVPDTRIDHAVVRLLAPLSRFRAARLGILAWLTVRLRPFRIRDVLMTAIDRQIEMQ